MAVQTPPFVLQASSHSAELVRRAVGSILAPGVGGTVSPGDFAVSQHAGTPAMNVDVAAGEIWVPGSLATRQGMYYGLNDAVATLTVAASDPTNPRLDRVCVTVNDAQYSGATNSIVLQVLTGIAAPSPALPAAPANSYTLAQVSVAALASSIVNANVTDLRSRLRLYSDPALHCYATRSAAWTTVTGPSTVLFDATSWDTGSNFSTGSHLFTCPVAGFYRVATMVEAAANAAGQYLQNQIVQNGAIVAWGSIVYSAASGNGLGAVATGTFKCAAGDTLGVNYLCSTNGLTGQTNTQTYATFDWAGSLPTG